MSANPSAERGNVEPKKLAEARKWLDYQSQVYFGTRKGLCDDPACDSVYCFIAKQLDRLESAPPAPRAAGAMELVAWAVADNTGGVYAHKTFEHENGGELDAQDYAVTMTREFPDVGPFVKAPLYALQRTSPVSAFMMVLRLKVRWDSLTAAQQQSGEWIQTAADWVG